MINQNQGVSCPGHTGKCRFCKSEQGYPRYVGQFKQVSRDGSPIVDECCRACKQNKAYVKRNYDPITAARFGARVPRGDEV